MWELSTGLTCQTSLSSKLCYNNWFRGALCICLLHEMEQHKIGLVSSIAKLKRDFVVVVYLCRWATCQER